MLPASFTATLEDAYARDLSIEFSSNLREWFPMTNYLGSNLPVLFSDPAASHSQRFYRAVIP
jgi:hypothetical protein